MRAYCSPPSDGIDLIESGKRVTQAALTLPVLRSRATERKHMPVVITTAGKSTSTACVDGDPRSSRRATKSQIRVIGVTIKTEEAERQFA
jgi:hypothetical protein